MPNEPKSIENIPNAYLNNKIEKLSDKKRNYTVLSQNIIKYQSKNGNNNNLNGQAKDRFNDPIVCRHLSKYLVHNLGKIKDYHHSYSSVYNIISIDFLREKEADGIKESKSAMEIYIVPLDKLGLILSKIADLLPYNQERAYSIESESHLMAISLQKKQNALVNETYYVIKFYDPNITNSHIRLISTAKEDLTNLKLKDFIDDASIQKYFPSVGLMVLCSSIRLKSNTSVANKEMSTMEVLSNDIVDELYLLADDGFEEQVYELITKRLNNISSDIAVSLLKKGWGGNSVMMLLVRKFENTRSLAAMMKKILNSEIDDNLKVNILTGDGKNCILAYVLEFNLIEQAKISIEAVINSNLNIDMKFIYLKGRITNNGAPGLFLAMQNNHFELIKLYIRLILESNFDDKLKGRLISPQADEGGESVFFRSMASNKKKLCNIYIDKILDSNLEDKEKVTLLLGERKDGLTALFVPFQEGHADIIDSYVNSVLKSKLESIHKVTLLKVINPVNQETGLDSAIRRNQADTVKAYMEAILHSKLNEETKLSLLKLNRYYLTRSESVKTYEKLVASLSLNLILKEGLVISLKQNNAPLLDEARRSALKRKRDNAPLFFKKVHMQAHKDNPFAVPQQTGKNNML